MFYDGTAPFAQRTGALTAAEQLLTVLARARAEISHDLGPFEWTEVEDSIDPQSFAPAVDDEGNRGHSICRMQGVTMQMDDDDFPRAVSIVTEVAAPLGFTHCRHADFDRCTVTHLYNTWEGGYISIGKTFGAGFSLRFDTGCRPWTKASPAA
ncbi:MAG: LppA family lipoprotein [Actinomycetaceae bacterium]|nr:LppA family lipoprotein [Actinomycetaceae bacterium]